MGKVVSVNISATKGTPKRPVDEIELVPGLGVKEDAHAAPGDRQVSLLMEEDIEEAAEKMKEIPECDLPAGKLDFRPGVFAENITTRGIDLLALKPGDEIKCGPARLRITRLGKECHRPCAIYYKTGDCIMPRRGIFAEVLVGGIVRPGDDIEKC